MSGTWQFSPTFLIPINMAPYTRWVLPSFKQTLVDACDTYLDTNDCSNEKSRSKLIARVSKDISDIVQANKEVIPDDLEKVTKPYIVVLLNYNQFPSVFAYGMETMHLDMRKRRGQQRPSWIHMVTDIIEVMDLQVGMCSSVYRPHLQ